MFRIQVTSGFLFCKIHATACMNNKGFFLQLKYTHLRVFTRICVKLHANACKYQISRFYTRAVTRTAHAVSTHCPRTAREYYTQTTRILRTCRCCNPFDRYCMEVEIIFLLFDLYIRLTVPVPVTINQQSNQHLLLGDHSGPISYKAWLGLR